MMQSIVGVLPTGALLLRAAWPQQPPRWSRLAHDERRAEILAAARRLFSERHFGAVSTVDIARAAGVAQGADPPLLRNQARVYLEPVRSMVSMPLQPVPTEIDGRDAEVLLAEGVDRWLEMLSREPRDLDRRARSAGLRSRRRRRGDPRAGPRGRGRPGDRGDPSGARPGGGSGRAARRDAGLRRPGRGHEPRVAPARAPDPRPGPLTALRGLHRCLPPGARGCRARAATSPRPTEGARA